MALAQQVESNVTERTSNGIWWVQLLTSDVEAAKAFYGPLLQWEWDADPHVPAVEVALRGGNVVAGIHERPDPHIPVNWMTFVLVDDVAATLARARELGAEIIMDTTEIGEGTGVTGVFADPGGAVLGIWTPGTGMHGVELVNCEGAMSWLDLRTHDAARDGEFYAGVFGWTVSKMDFPGMDYWTLDNGGRPVAGMMQFGTGEAQAPAHWGVTFGVERADDAADWTREQGGSVTFGPMDSRFGRTLGIQDPQGGYVNLIQPPAGGWTQG